jgi:hypothetical protein
MSKEKLEADKLLNTFYECKICGAMFPVERVDDVLECARQPVSPKYTVEDMVTWRKCVVRITERVIIPCSHKFLFGW